MICFAGRCSCTTYHNSDVCIPHYFHNSNIRCTRILTWCHLSRDTYLTYKLNNSRNTLISFTHWRIHSILNDRERTCGRVQLKCDGTQWRMGGEVKGKLANGVGSQYHFTLPRNVVYPALLPLMRTPWLPVVEWTDAPRLFKWTRPFRRRTKSGFCACATTFQTQSTTMIFNQSSIDRIKKRLLAANVTEWQGQKLHCNTSKNCSLSTLKKWQLNCNFLMQNFTQSKELIVW
jgi:hypothetical protein